MKKVFGKRYLVLTLTLFFILGCMLALLSACSSSTKKFYTLEEAYKKHYLTKDDLTALATERHDSDLDSKIQEDLLKDYLEYYQSTHHDESLNRYPDYTADDFSIIKYWGEYQGYIVVQIHNPGELYPQVGRTITVAGIEIGYTAPEPLVWKIPETN